MKRYYGFKFWDGRNTTTGQPNPRTGRMSIAGDLQIFTKKEQRDQWVADAGEKTRISCTPSEARRLHRGMDSAAYNEMIDHLTWEAENE